MSLKGPDNKGNILVGLDRGAIERVLAGERLCLPAVAGAPHVCVFFEETDELLVERLRNFYPGEPLPPIVDLRKPVGEKP